MQPHPPPYDKARAYDTPGNAPFHVGRSVPFLTHQEAIRYSHERAHALMFELYHRLLKKSSALKEDSHFKDFSFVSDPSSKQAFVANFHGRVDKDLALLDPSTAGGADVAEEHRLLEQSLKFGDALLPECLRTDLAGFGDRLYDSSLSFNSSSDRKILADARQPPEIPLAARREVSIQPISSTPEESSTPPLSFEIPDSRQSEGDSASSRPASPAQQRTALRSHRDRTLERVKKVAPNNDRLILKQVQLLRHAAGRTLSVLQEYIGHFSKKDVWTAAHIVHHLMQVRQLPGFALDPKHPSVRDGKTDVHLYGSSASNPPHVTDAIIAAMYQSWNLRQLRDSLEILHQFHPKAPRPVPIHLAPVTQRKRSAPSAEDSLIEGGEESSRKCPRISDPQLNPGAVLSEESDFSRRIKKIQDLSQEMLNPLIVIRPHTCQPIVGGRGPRFNPHPPELQQQSLSTQSTMSFRPSLPPQPLSLSSGQGHNSRGAVGQSNGHKAVVKPGFRSRLPFQVQVVRDDFLVGGTKQRALALLFTTILRRALEKNDSSTGDVLEQEREFVYAGPVYGYAQVALAHTCYLLSKFGLARKATAFCASQRLEHRQQRRGGQHNRHQASGAASGDLLAQVTVIDPEKPAGEASHLHPLTKMARSWGARVCEMAPPNHLSELQKAAEQYVERQNQSSSPGRRTRTILLPFGLDCEQFVDALAEGVWESLPQEFRTGLPGYVKSERLRIAELKAATEGVDIETHWIPTAGSFDSLQQDQKNPPSPNPSEMLPQSAECVLMGDEYQDWERALSSGPSPNLDSEFAKVALAQRLLPAPRFPLRPIRMWLVAGSGTLLQTFGRIWPDCHFLVVMVGKKIWPRQLQGLRVTLFVAPEPFQKDSPKQPPFPSVSNYDAKLWQFVELYGRDGDWVWNVGRDVDDRYTMQLKAKYAQRLRDLHVHPEKIK